MSNSLSAIVPQDNLAAAESQPDLKALAATIRGANQGVALAAANMIEQALAAGDALIAAKIAVKATRGPGHWLEWLKDECNLSEDRAERYMRIARGRAVLEANSARVRNLSLTGALKLLPSPQPAGSSRPGSRSPQSPSRPQPNKPQAVTRHEAAAGWASWSPDERRHFIDGIGSRDLAAAIPASWNLTLAPAGESVGQIAKLHKQIAALQASIQQREIMIRDLHRRLGTRPSGIFGISNESASPPAQGDGDGLEAA